MKITKQEEKKWKSYKTMWHSLASILPCSVVKVIWRSFFAHEIQSFPPSLSNFGKLHSQNCWNALFQMNWLNHFQIWMCSGWMCSDRWCCHCALFTTTSINTFKTMLTRKFIQCFNEKLQNNTRVGVVWDTYVPSSLKDSTWEKKKGFSGKSLGDQSRKLVRFSSGSYQ